MALGHMHYCTGLMVSHTLRSCPEIPSQDMTGRRAGEVGQRAPDQPSPCIHLLPVEKGGCWDLTPSLRTSENTWLCVKRKVGCQGGSEPWLAGSLAPTTPKLLASIRARCGQCVLSRMLAPGLAKIEPWAESWVHLG